MFKNVCSLFYLLEVLIGFIEYKIMQNLSLSLFKVFVLVGLCRTQPVVRVVC